MQDVLPEIEQLAKRVSRHEQDPWLEVDGCVWVRLEAVIAIEPVEQP